MSRDNLVTGLVAAALLLLFAAYWAYRRSTLARLREPSPDAATPDGSSVPFAILFGFWMFMRRRTPRPPPAAPENPSGRPVVTQRSRRMALLPIVIVLGIFTIVRALIEH
jgi:hypothetical protein